MGAASVKAYERLLRREIRTQHRAALAAQVALDRWPVAGLHRPEKVILAMTAGPRMPSIRRVAISRPSTGQHAAIAVDIERALLRAVVTQQQSRHAEETDAALGALCR